MNDDIKRALKVALAAGLTGGALGGGAKFLGGAEKLSEILKAAGAGAGIGGAVGGGSNLIGSELMGQPEYGEANPNARRGGLGGGVAGAVAGGVLGGLGAAGKFPKGLAALLGKTGEVPENMITRYIAKLGVEPTERGIIKGAGLGAAALGIPAAYYGMDEGMGYDTVQREMDHEQKKRMAIKAMEKMMMGEQ